MLHPFKMQENRAREIEFVVVSEEQQPKTSLCQEAVEHNG